jgi:two-component system repressor protein LuxO
MVNVETGRQSSAAAPWRPARVLLVEDNPGLAWTYQHFLAGEPVALEHVASGAEALERIASDPPAVMLLDLILPDLSGLEVLAQVQAARAPITTIVMTAHSDVEIAVRAMRAGAYDFLTKPFDAGRLLTTLRNALERQRLAGVVETLRRTRFAGFLGASLPMQALYRAIESVAQSKAPVFITGESGTGKELCAQAVHACGPRRDGPFVALNCAAIARELMESELFGHTKGAFTGAHIPRKGAARQANGGTLFLDEICELDLTLQGKLLRFVQTGTLRTLGSDTLERVDLRLVCATNKDPWAEVAAGRLREDLYYRLHVVPLAMPALRERDDDIVLLAHHFLHDMACEEGKSFEGFDAESEALLRAHTWPGNVRELQNVIRHVVVFHRGPVVRPSMLPAQLRSASAETTRAPARTPQSLRAVERHTIEKAIAAHDGNITHAARALGVDPSTLHRKRRAWDQAQGSAI